MQRKNWMSWLAPAMKQEVLAAARPYVTADAH